MARARCFSAPTPSHLRHSPTPISYLEDGDCAVLTRSGAEVRDAEGSKVERAGAAVLRFGLLVDKGNYRHFMAKEIHEQPEVVGHTLAHYLDMAAERVRAADSCRSTSRQLERLSISACGTAYYAGLVAQILVRAVARLPVDIDIASEFRYREAPLEPDGLAIFVSQSGETADTLAALRYAKEQQQHVLAVVNVPTSTIARESDVVMPTLAGPEIGVASTKAFTCQLAVLACLAIAAGRARGVLSAEEERTLVRALIEVPRLMAEALRAGAENRAAGARSRARAATCSISAAARAFRWRWKARSSSRKSPISMPRAMRPASSSTGRSRSSTRKCRSSSSRPYDRDLRKDSVQHAGGRRARRENHPDDGCRGAQKCRG